MEDALLYLDQVKMTFEDKPEIYNKFLDIMKNFKAQEIDTPGVIQQVSHLFRGYNKLILGFNTFLPDGYKIELPLDGNNATMTVITPAGVSASIVGGPVIPRQGTTQGKNTGGSISKPSDAIVRPDVAGAPVEFDHAITYVTTIKKRFAHEPETYKAFLEILHTYQKEQRSIKDVLEQVSQLFADHSDLLKEFTYFLPDAVQEQAKERLSRAARESELRRGQHLGGEYNLEYHASSRLVPVQCSADDQSRWPSAVGRGSRTAFDSTSGLPHTKCNISTVHSESIMYPRIEAESKAMSGRPIYARYTSCAIERQLFEKIREFLNATGTLATAPDAWNQFLKCLDLHSQDLLQRSDLIRLVSGLFSSHGLSIELLEAVQRILRDGDGIYSATYDDKRKYRLSEEQNKYSSGSLTPLHDMDFSSCVRHTPSYRALPMSLVQPNSQGRLSLELAVLNDMCASVSSEKACGFLHPKKDKHEQDLFQLEDQRYELDMIIDANSTCVAVLESITTTFYQNDRSTASKTRICHEKQVDCSRHSSNYAINANVDAAALSNPHLNAISAVYGKHSGELIELINNNPRFAIPLVLERLKRKGKEYRNMREIKSYSWEEVINRNLHRALDQRAFHFRQNERKIKLSCYLMRHILGSTHTEIGRSSLQRVIRQHETTTLLDDDPKDETEAFRKDIFLQLGRRSLHRTLFRLILNAVEQSCIAQHDKQLIANYWQHFFFHFVHLSNDNHKIEPTVSPWIKYDVSDELMIGSRQIYMFFRLYHLLFQRYEFAWKLGDNPTLVPSGCQSEYSSQDHPRITAFDTLVRGLLDGSLDSGRYEGGCRLLFGASSFVFFSIDNLIVQLLKQLQCVVNDIQSSKLVDLWKEREVLKRKKHLDDCTNKFSDVSIRPSMLSSYKARAEHVTYCPGKVVGTLYAVRYYTHSNKCPGLRATLDAISIKRLSPSEQSR